MEKVEFKKETITGIANALRAGLGDIGPIKGDELDDRALELVEMMDELASSGAKITFGKILGWGETSQLLTHNLGAVPGVFFVFTNSNLTSGRVLYYALGFSEAMATKIGAPAKGSYGTTGTESTGTLSYSIETTNQSHSGQVLSSATEKSIKMGCTNSSKPITVDTIYYHWCAIGGLS